MMKNLKVLICFFFLSKFLQTVSYGQESTKEDVDKKHFISINPVKPFIGLPNIHYEYQIRKSVGLTAFSEVLAYEIVNNFNHPDMVNTLGVSFYPFMKEINQGLFININTSYILYFRNNLNSNSFANGVQIGYKLLLKNDIFIEPKVVFNYVYREHSLLPGFEVLVGLRF